LEVVAIVAKHAIINSEPYATNNFLRYKYLFIFITPEDFIALS